MARARDDGSIEFDPGEEENIRRVAERAVGQVIKLDGYHESGEVAAVATELIAVHPRFQDLIHHTILYAELHGKEPDDGTIHAIAKAVKAPAIWRDLKAVEGVIWVNHRWWTVAPENARRAVVAHELCHFYEGENGRLKIADHDVEEFAFVARHFGAWRGELGQLRLALDEGPKG